MRNRWLFVALCSGVLLSLAPPALAVSPDATSLKQAQERFQEGNRKFAAGDYEAARVAYQQSLVLAPRASTYMNLGAAELKLGDPVAALKHLRIAMAAPDLTADKKPVAERHFGDAYGATGHIAVLTSPGATVTVDGHEVEGRAPFAEQIDVTAGRHTLEAHLGERSSKFEVEAKPGQVSSIDLAIATAPSPPPATPEPSPAVAPSTSPIPSSGTPVGAESDIPQPSSFWNTRREVGLAVAGAGVLAIGAAVIFSVEGSNEGNHARSLASGLPSNGACAGGAPPTGCGALQDARSSQKTDSTMSGVFLGVGGAAFVAGAAMFLWPSPAKGGQTAIIPYFSPQGGGLQIQGEL